MDYKVGQGELENWLVCEDTFNTHYLGKCETIMALGNGYMGARSATEETYKNEVRNSFISGTFNRFDENEVTELPNCADVFGITIEIDGELLDFTQGTLMNHSRVLNLKNGELTRKVEWIDRNNKQFEFTFRRFISLNNLHLTGHQILIQCVNSDAKIHIRSGINGQMTNSGVQHFSEGEKRLFNKKTLQMIQHTTQSGIDFVINSVHNFKINLENFDPQSIIQMDRRKIFCEYDMELMEGQQLTFEKFAYFSTSRDKDTSHLTLDTLRIESANALNANAIKGYDLLLNESAIAWQEQVWGVIPIEIDCDNGFDQLAIRFAQYHLRIMTPYHDNRMSIGAKGLTGEGYKGHTFWDTEIFILPYYSYCHPEIARKLIEYRYLSLEGARRKASENGYEGAMFPWESAWLTDGEVTPIWGAADIITGKSTKIWSGFIEQHITADIAFATWQYVQITGDQDFLNQFGYELILDTAKFWNSRLEYSDHDQKYHINNVVGPDEYKEHVDDNAFTNYMAVFNIRLALSYYQTLKKEQPVLFTKLNSQLDLDRVYKQWVEKIDAIFLPLPNDNGVIPQDSTYLQKKTIDLSPYKNQEHVGSIFRVYNLEQVNEIQVTKQADVMILMYLLENQFNKDLMHSCFEYYEGKTLHDSSLSLSTHSVLASDLGHYDLAYKLFEQAAAIDLGPNMKSSDHGIHSASLGGVWQCVVNGFGGVRVLNGTLRIEPHLPKSWKQLKFGFYWQGEKLQVTINSREMMIEKEPATNYVSIEVYGDKYLFDERIKIAFS